MWDNLPIDADRRMAVCSVEWTAVVNGGKFKFKPIESCLCLVLNIQFTSQQPLVSGEMKLLPLQHFSISPESWLLSSHRSLSLQIWRLEICYWFCNSIFSSNIWHGFWQKAAMISWLKYIDQLQHRHTDELWIPIKAKFWLVLWVPVWQIKLLNTFPCGATRDWPGATTFYSEFWCPGWLSDTLTPCKHRLASLGWAMFLSSVIHSDTSKRHTILPKQWGRIPLESVSVSIMGDLQQETEAAALYFILIALSQASLSRALTPSAFVLCPVCCSAQMETSANSSRFSQPVENLEKALFKHHQHNNERETTNRKRFWETDMRKPATKFPILCNNNFHPAPAACCSSGIVNFNFSRASLLLISPVIHHNTAGRQHQHHQGPTFEVKHTKSKAPFFTNVSCRTYVS